MGSLPSSGPASAATSPELAAVRRPRRPARILLLALMLAGAGAACDTAPQVVAITPDRGAQQVPSNADVSVRFDRPMDHQSVASRFSVEPAVTGSVSWASSSELVFKHAPFRASTTYSVRLRGGYRDTAGHVNALDHGWTFRTEAPPTLTGSVPAAGEQNVDPAAFVTLAFSREMDLGSLASAVSISPPLQFALRVDPLDARRTVISPRTILDPTTTYAVTVTRDARDVDGNSLATGVTLDFATGATRPLRHWVTFTAESATTGAGVWVVDENRLPRQVTGTPASQYSWSLDGTALLLQGVAGRWTRVELGGGGQELPFSGSWAAFLAPGFGYAVLDGGVLSIYRSGQLTTVDQGVREVAVAPNGLSLAYTVPVASGYEIRGYQVELRSHYRLQAEPGRIDSLAWAPDASQLAYRLATADPARYLLRDRDLAASGSTTTVAIGALSRPDWQADSRHLILSATVIAAQGPVSRAFRVSVSVAATLPLALDSAIPDPTGIDIVDPAPSPDGHQLAFLAPTTGGDQVWLMNVDGTGLAELTAFDARSFPYSCQALAWTRS
jgi:hypothetical protein